MTAAPSNWRLSVRETGDDIDRHEIVITEHAGPNGPTKRIAWDMARDWAVPHASRIVVVYLDGSTKTVQDSGFDLMIAAEHEDEMAAENAYVVWAETRGQGGYDFEPDWAS